MKKKLTTQNAPRYYERIVEKLKTVYLDPNGPDRQRGTVATESKVNFLIASGGRKDGRTTTAIGLAVATAVAKPTQSVVLVDLDHRNPALGSMLQIPGADSATGILNVIQQNADFEDAAQLTNLENLHVVCRGSGNLSVPEDCQSEALRSTLQHIRSRYDYAFFDSPPLNEYVDARLLSRSMDGVLLVVRCDRSKKEDILAAKNQIPREKLAGAIANDFRDPVPSFISRSL